ncbi:MAG: DUF2934 domain-containing protein [Candidatus Korobacteraceae bacterium]
MPKATRAKDSQETPKKRSRKTQPADGNGTDAVQPVTTAPAIAETTPQVIAQQEQETPKKRSVKTSPVARTKKGAEPLSQVNAEAGKVEVISEARVTENSVAPARHNGHVSEELVRRRAYELYLERRGQGGSPEQDWFRALQEIQGQHVA